MRKVLVVCCVLLFCLLAFPLVAQELKEGYYPDGKLRYKGYFRNGQPVGEMTHYFPDGKVKAVMNYAGDTVDAVLYTASGEYTMSGKYKDRKKVGKWEYRKGKQLLYMEEYDSDILNGLSEKYYPAGQVSEKKNWKQGMPSGLWQLFYDTGKLKMEAVYVDGRLNGPLKSYDYKGGLIVEGFYQNNRKEGVWKYFDEAGKLKAERTYVNGAYAGYETEELEETKQIDDVVRKGEKIPDPANFVDAPEDYLKIIGD